MTSLVPGEGFEGGGSVLVEAVVSDLIVLDLTAQSPGALEDLASGDNDVLKDAGCHDHVLISEERLDFELLGLEVAAQVLNEAARAVFAVIGAVMRNAGGTFDFDLDVWVHGGEQTFEVAFAKGREETFDWFNGLVIHDVFPLCWSMFCLQATVPTIRQYLL